jgi:Na+/melibiose symporter-like transporter
MFVCLIPLLFYKLTGENKRKVMDELAERRAAAAVLAKQAGA